MELTPPADPDDWTDEQWLAWLAEVEAAPAPEPAVTGRHRWQRTTSARALYGGMVAMHDVIYGRTEEPTIVVEASGDPPDSEALEVHLEPDDPDDSTVVVRPWLMHADEHEPEHPGND